MIERVCPGVKNISTSGKLALVGLIINPGYFSVGFFKYEYVELHLNFT